METPEIKNATIESARITNDDHGLLTAWIYLNYGKGGSGQGFGGFALYLPSSFKNHTSAYKANYAGHFIWRVLEVAGVAEWKDLPGKTVRARATFSNIEAIGHITDDDWFCPKIDFEAMTPKKGD